jgi:hypothetical protein
MNIYLLAINKEKCIDKLNYFLKLIYCIIHSQIYCIYNLKDIKYTSNLNLNDIFMDINLININNYYDYKVIYNCKHHLKKFLVISMYNYFNKW